jgi:CheY-like chemotaxis protein
MAFVNVPGIYGWGNFHFTCYAGFPPPTLRFATLLHREVPSDSRAGFYVQQVRQAGQRAKEQVEQIITFSRAEPYSHEPLQLNQVVQEALTLLRASLPTTIDIQYRNRLPWIEAPVMQAAAPAPPLPQGQGCVLLVDDETTVTLAMWLLLDSLRYEAVVYTTSRDALAAFCTEPHRFDVVITDQTMAQMTGEDLVHALRQVRPDIPIILCTGFSHVMEAEKAKALGLEAFLMKPLDEHDLATMLQQVVSRHPEGR